MKTTRKLPFISPLSWIIPLTYAGLITLIGQRKNYGPHLESMPLQPQEQEAGVVKSRTHAGPGGIFEEHRPYHVQPGEITHDGESDHEDEIRPPPGLHPSLRKSRPVVFALSIVAASLGIIQWGVTIGVIVIHWRSIWTKDLSKRLLQYTLHSKALEDPRALGPNVPSDCLNWFRDANVDNPALGRFTLQRDQLIISLVPTIQFGMASLFLLSLPSIIRDPFKRSMSITAFVFGQLWSASSSQA